MSIKPVDFQVAIPRTTEVSKIGGNDANKNHAVQQQTASTVQHKAEESLRQVYSRTKAEDARITEKQKEEGKKGGQKGGKKGGSSPEKAEEERKAPEKDLKKEVQRSTIDIKI